MRLYLYSHNTRGLGHAARNAAIAQGIFEISPESSTLSVTGAMAQISELLPGNADYVKLPSFDGIEQNGELVIVPQRLNIKKKELIKLRSSILEAAALSFRPDVFLVDFSPVGKGGELTHTLERVRSELPDTLIYLGIRDITGQLPDNSLVYSNEVVDFINQHYDAVFYYGDPLVIPYETDPFTLTRSKGLKIPVIPTGYITRQNAVNPTKSCAIRNMYAREGDFLVVASAGGGKHSYPFFQAVVQACRARPKINGQTIRLHLITGPYFSNEDQQALEELACGSDWVSSVKFVPNMVDYIGAADLFIGTGGYNTMTEIMVAQKPSIIVTRMQVDSIEQSLRTKLFETLGICDSVTWDDNLAARLEDRMVAITSRHLHLKSPRPLDMNGKKRAAEMILNGIEGLKHV